MIIRRAKDIRPSQTTPYGAYLNRRQFISAGTALSLGTPLAQTVRADTLAAAKSPLSTDEKPTALKYVTSYNNYYEFGTGCEERQRIGQRIGSHLQTLRGSTQVRRQKSDTIEFCVSCRRF